jgi:hypothetical protein
MHQDGVMDQLLIRSRSTRVVGMNQFKKIKVERKYCCGADQLLLVI